MASQPKAHESSKLPIACMRCRSRKRRCTGQKPRCRGCVTHDWECRYPTVRETRGRGKSKSAALRTAREAPSTEAPIKSDEQGCETSCVTTPRQVQVDWLPTLPKFLTSDNCRRNLEAVKASLASDGSFTPLLPRHMAAWSITSSYADIQASRLLSLPDFLRLLRAQYAASRDGPAGDDAARWAIVNAVTALTVRFKTAPGADEDMAPIALAYYRNAALVAHELVRDAPTLLSVQALLGTAMAARCAAEAAHADLLLRNAMSQLEWLRDSGHINEAEYLRAFEVGKLQMHETQLEDVTNP